MTPAPDVEAVCGGLSEEPEPSGSNDLAVPIAILLIIGRLIRPAIILLAVTGGLYAIWEIL